MIKGVSELKTAAKSKTKGLVLEDLCVGCTLQCKNKDCKAHGGELDPNMRVDPSFGSDHLDVVLVCESAVR